MDGIERAIMHGAEAGKLRAYVRENGGGLAGLMRLADRHSSGARTSLDEIIESVAPAEPVARFVVRDRPGTR